MKLVSAGASGSKQMVTSRCSACATAFRKVAAAQSQACSRGNARQHVALFGRADDHHFAAQVGAEIHQVAEVLGRALAQAAVGVIDIEPLGLHQHPVNAGDLYPVPRRRLAHGLALAGGNIRHRIRQGERGDLHSGVAEPRGVSQGVLQLPALKDLVADGEFHPGQTRGLRSTVQDGNGGRGRHAAPLRNTTRAGGKFRLCRLWGEHPICFRLRRGRNLGG